MDKRHLVRQLETQIRRVVDGALGAATEAAAEARAALDPTERQDRGVATEHARMARGQQRRHLRAMEQLAHLSSFDPRPLAESESVRVGAIVEIEDEETGRGRTFFLAPAGAGSTLHGPDGDGVFTVVTPSSPIGKAVLGRRVGDVVDVTLNGEVREWAITWVA